MSHNPSQPQHLEENLTIFQTLVEPQLTLFCPRPLCTPHARTHAQVGEIVDRAQKEEKMEQALKKLDETWVRVEFNFIRFKDTTVYTTKMADEDFEVRRACSSM